MHLEIAPTPIQKINWDNNNNNFYIKRDDLIPFSFGGSKVRIANEFLYDIEGTDYDCIIAYGQSQSNLCRIIANLSALLKLPCYIISAMEEGASYHDTYNSIMVKSFGAHIITCNKTEVAQTIGSLMDKLKSEGYRPYYIYGSIYGKGREAVASNAYRKAYKEIHDYAALYGNFDYIFHASGTGTTQAGLIAGIHDYNDPVKLIGISIARREGQGKAAIQDNLKSLGLRIDDSFINFDDRYCLEGYAKYNDDVRQVIADMLSLNGIPLDTTYTGKAFWGMNEFICEHDINNKKILFIHTGGTPLFFDYLSQ